MSKSKKVKLPNTQANEKAVSKSSYEDFMVLLFVGAFLFIDFLPYFKSFEIIAPQFLYLTILNIFVSLYIYSNPALHQAALVNVFKRSYIFIAHVGFILLCSVSIFFSNNISLGVVSLAEILVAFAMVVNFTALFYNRMHLIVKVAFLVGVVAFLQAGRVLYNFHLEANLKPVYEVLNSNVMKGNSGNLNILAASLLYKVPFIYFGVISYRNWKRWFLSVAIIFALTVIFLINARAALLSLIVVSIIFSAYCFKIGKLKGKAALQFLYIIVPVIISFVSANLIFQQSASDPRFVSTADRLSNINVEDGSINRRLVFYRAALDLAKESPIVGIGLGSYRIESIPLDLSTNGTVPLHAHNDFLELLAETGFLNGLLYFSIFVVLLAINLKRLFRSSDALVSKISLLALLLLVVYGVDALFNFPFYRPTMQVCFSFLMAFTFVNIRSEEKGTALVNKKLLIGLVALCALPLYFTYHAYKTSNLEYLIQTDNINFASSGVLNGDEVVGRNPKFPNVFQSSESFVEYAGIYYFREKKYAEAIKLLDSANQINPYLGRPDFYKYLIAAERGLPDSAYFYAKSAFYKRPVNDNFFETATTLAAARRDTTEILKMYEAFPSILTKPASWSKAYLSLNAAGYSKNGLERFKELALKNFPTDTTVRKSINQLAVTDYIVKGQNLFTAGKHLEALNSYQLGLKLDPTNIYVNQNIGFYYFNLSKPSLAIPYFKTALAQPGLNGGKTEFYLGLCYLNVGDKENACKYFKLAGNYPDAEKLLAANCR